ncbi:MAG: thioredoxin family protein [Elainellaceae cyanobacterium]
MAIDAPSDTQAPNSQTAQNNPPTSLRVRIRNFLVVLVAVILSASVFVGSQTATGSESLTSLAKSATTYEVATTNQKPSLVEFYANWCTSCQAMAGDMAQMRAEYGDRINFVMLNVDNSKWLPEMLKYRVDGIPHFLFMDADGQAIASAIGEQPKTVLAENLAALSLGEVLPYQQSLGRQSEVEESASFSPAFDDPRSHGAQVVAQ